LEGIALNGPAALLNTLRAAADLDTAAIACLRHLIDTAAVAITASAFPGGRVLRATLHLRPDEEYAGLYALESGADTLTPPADNKTLLPSATVWRWLGEHQEPVAVDVGAQTLRPKGAAAPTGTFPATAAAGGFSRASHQRLLQREVTHLYALPLHAPGARLVGMATVEASCPAAVTRPFVWPACTEALEWVTALASPYLVALPREALAGLDGDPNLGEVDLPGALYGLLLAVAVNVAGSRDAAFRLLGRGELVTNRNHHRVLRREASRAIELCRALREAPPPELTTLLASFGP